MARRGFGRNEGLTDTQVGRNIAGQLGTIFTLKPQAKYLTGARTTIRVNGSIVAFAFQVTWNVRTDATEIYTIDDPLPWEIAPKTVSVSGTLGLFQLPGESPTAKLLQADVATFLMNKYITIEVKDSASDNVIFKTNKAIVTGQQGEVSSEKLSTMMLTWTAVGWRAENQPSEINEDKMKTSPSSTKTKGSWDKSKEKLGF